MDFFLVLYGTLHFGTIVCSFTTAVVYMVTKELRDLQSYCVLHLALNLAISRTFWHVMLRGYDIIQEHDILCVSHSYLWYYFVISTFTWICCLSYSFWQTVKGNAGNIATNRMKLIYTLFGYGFPIVFCSISIAILQVFYHYNFHTVTGCYRGLVIFQILPLLLVIWVFWLPNLFLFIASMMKLRKDGAFQANRGSRLKVARFRFCLYLKLFIVMGLPYSTILLMFLLHYIHWAPPIAVLGSFTTLVMANMILGEGIWLFLLMVVFRKKARKAFANMTIYGCHIFPAFMRRNSSRQSETEEEEDDDVTPPVRYNEQRSVDIENNLPI